MIPYAVIEKRIPYYYLVGGEIIKARDELPRTRPYRMATELLYGIYQPILFGGAVYLIESTSHEVGYSVKSTEENFLSICYVSQWITRNRELWTKQKNTEALYMPSKFSRLSISYDGRIFTKVFRKVGLGFYWGIIESNPGAYEDII